MTGPETTTPGPPPPQPWPRRFDAEGPDAPQPTSDERTMAMLAHALALVAGAVAPLVIWLARRESSPYVDHHGREALNFQITVLLCAALTLVGLCIPMVGFVMALPAALALAVVNVVFTLLAAVRANEGVRHRYPFCIRLVR